MGLAYFKNKKLRLEQQQTARLNKKRLEIKAERIRAENRAKIQQEINSDKKKITNLSNSKKSKLLEKFGNNIKKNLNEKKKPNPLFTSSSGSNPYNFGSSGSNPYDFSGTTKKKKIKKKGGKTITIRL